jgi:hypothetical protein
MDELGQIVHLPGHVGGEFRLLQVVLFQPGDLPVQFLDRGRRRRPFRWVPDAEHAQGVVIDLFAGLGDQRPPLGHFLQYPDHGRRAHLSSVSRTFCDSRST